MSAISLAYSGRDAYHLTGAWTQPAWLTAVIYLPFLALLAADALRAKHLAGRRQVARGEQAGERDGG